MAMFQKIREYFIAPAAVQPEKIVTAPATAYEIRPLTETHIKEVLKLNLRCFKTGENYTKYTFSYLLNEPNCLSYRIAATGGEMVGFVFIMTHEDSTAHITTIGIAPEHRRRGLAKKLLQHAEEALQKRKIATLMLEVRAGNFPAQNLYRKFGYSNVQRLPKYYNNGEDGFLMVKPLH